MIISRIYSYILVLFTLSLTAQVQTNNIERCGTMRLDQHYRELILDYATNRIASEQNVKSKLYANKSAGKIIIPVVIHVIYRLDDQNISDAQIQSQLDVMNKDFNKLNWDTMLVPAVWKPLIADCELEFKLANRDPDGNVTSGITRTKTSITDIASETGTVHYQTSQGGHDIWDRNSYLNIWVCEISGNTYGFASFPGAPAMSDGITIDFISFGINGTSKLPTDRGRTVTHEVGHWLDLFHVWGPNSNLNCESDFIDDTPIQRTANFSTNNICPFFPDTSCFNDPNGDMFMNYMDYVDDKCMHMFTLDQKTRMIATLNGIRSSILTSSGYDGINELSADNFITMSPNPCNDFLHIDWSDNIEVHYIQLIDLQGSVIYSENYTHTANELSIEVQNFINGIYFVRIQTSKGWISKKILVNHQ